jgi:hypothetical protein
MALALAGFPFELDGSFTFAAQKCMSRGGRLRTFHVSMETISARPRYGCARSKAGDLASRQEGATAEKAVPFSKLRLSIVIQKSGERDHDVDVSVRDRGDDLLLPLCSGGHDERRGLTFRGGSGGLDAKARNEITWWSLV